MPKVGDIFGGGKAWKAADLDKPVVLTISAVKPYDFDDGTKLIVSFKESEKDLIMNKTNAKLTARSYGDDTDDWVGKRIQLYKTTTEFKGDIVDCVRVQGPKTAPPAPPPEFGEPPASEDGDPGPADDPLPF